MAKIHELEQRFFDAIREPETRYHEARQILKEMHAHCTDSQRLALLEVAVDWRETRQYMANLKRLYEEVIGQETSDPVVCAKAFVVAAKLYAYEVTEETRGLMALIEEQADHFFGECDHPEALRWWVGYDLNMALTYLREGRFEDAELSLLDVVDRSKGDGDHACWRTKAYILLALLYTERLEFDQAHRFLDLSIRCGTQCDLSWRLYAMGRLIYEETHDLKEAAAYYHSAYAAAKQQQDYFLMADVLLALGFVHGESGNLEAFWYAYTMCHDLKERFGVPGLAVFEELAADTPKLQERS